MFEGDENWLHISKVWRFTNAAKIAIFLNVAYALGRQNV